MKFEGIVLACVLMAAGCSTPEGPYVAVAKPGNPEAAGKPVVLLNHDLLRTLAVDKPVTVERDELGRMRVTAGLRNRTDDENLQVQVQTLWRNEAGAVLYGQAGSEPPWESMRITPNQTVYYTQTALTAEATKYTIRVRYARPLR